MTLVQIILQGAEVYRVEDLEVVGWCKLVPFPEGTGSGAGNASGYGSTYGNGHGFGCGIGLGGYMDRDDELDLHSGIQKEAITYYWKL